MMLASPSCTAPQSVTWGRLQVHENVQSAELEAAHAACAQAQRERDQALRAMGALRTELEALKARQPAGGLEQRRNVLQQQRVIMSRIDQALGKSPERRRS
eukprot:TRINITY_DN4196_c0_g1_i5.p1 TRINITY_DN4196_c0_g1~~TRINITY_DN4196_c0_g1_i5.p1  ORF type:complete len:101 (-),score=24.16 TRINITY_DN4196_c0_g1_i5:221-523(-)